MSRLFHSMMAASAATLLAACSGQDSQAPAGLTPLTGAASLTTQPSQAHLLVTNGDIKPLITVGDSLPSASGGTLWAPIPDGLGGYQLGGDLVLYANHELTSGGVKDINGVTQFPNARVSRLVIDRRTLAVKDASYVVTGSEGYQRLCSATWVGAAEGFPSGFFFTGEESTGGTHDGIQLAIGTDGVVHELPWIGRFAHENLIGVPYRGKVVAIGTDDTAGFSELYMYVGDTEADIINGTGKLYVLVSSAAPNSGALKVNEPVRGSWVEVPSPASLSSAALQTTVSGLGAFPFVRLEDSDYDHRANGKPAIYFVDTGSQSTLCNGVACDPYGSIYRLELDPTSPTGPARLGLLARSSGAASGWSSPDNIAHNGKTLMVQEDPANATFAGQRAPQIYQFSTGTTARLGAGQAVVALENSSCDDVAGTCWESSGIIDASAWFGPGFWLFDVQAHTLASPGANLPKESGQLLLLRIRGS